MATPIDTIRTYFGKLGLETEIADIYLALHTHGPQNISELSRSAGVERTRIYRLIDPLLESNLIEVESKGTRGVVKAAPIANLHILIRQKEEELKSLQDELGLIEQVLARNSLSSPGLRLQMYYGRDGIRHMLSGELRATQGVIGYQGESPQEYVGKDFWENWQRDLKKHHIERQMAPTEEIDTKKATSCSIYGDVVAFYLWKDGDMYGVELYSKELAAAQTALITPLLARHAKTQRSSKSPS
jgi:sugar-specific transcriptional regulator TrmB